MFIQTIITSVIWFMLCFGQMVFCQAPENLMNHKNSCRAGVFYAEGKSASLASLSYERELISNFSLIGTFGYGWNYTSWLSSGGPPTINSFMGMIQPRYYVLLNKRQKLEGFFVSAYFLYFNQSRTKYEDPDFPARRERITRPEFGLGIGFQYQLINRISIGGEFMNGYHFKKIHYHNQSIAPPGSPFVGDLGGFGLLRFHVQLGYSF